MKIIEDSAAVKCILITASLIAENNRRAGTVLSASQWMGLVRFVNETTDSGFEDGRAVAVVYLIASGQQAYALPVNRDAPPALKTVR